MNRDVELEFGSIDSSGVCVSLQHLRRPCLVKRTKLFRQPSGSDEGAGAITLQGSHKLLRMGTIRSPAACRGSPSAAGLSFRNVPTINPFAMTRMGCETHHGLMMGFARAQPILRFAAAR